MVDAYRSEQGQSYVFISLRKENFLNAVGLTGTRAVRKEVVLRDAQNLKRIATDMNGFGFLNVMH